MLGVKGKISVRHAELKKKKMMNSQYLISRPKPALCIPEYDAKMRSVWVQRKLQRASI